MKRATSFRVAAPLALATLLTVASACNDDTATVLAPVGRTYNFLLLKEGANGPRAAGAAVVVRRPVGATTTQVTSTIADFTIAGLEPLTPPAGYVMWIASIAAPVAPSTDNTISNVARLRTRDFLAIEVDTTISPLGDFIPDVDTLRRQLAAAIVPAFNFGGPGVTYTFRTDSATLGFYPHNRNIIFMTVVTDTANPGTPATDGTDARLWLRYTATIPALSTAVPPVDTSTTTAAAAAFGNGHATASKQFPFIMSGRGRGSLVPDKNVLIVDDSLLARPPKGYYYETFLVKRDTAPAQKFFSTDTISIGAQTAPAPRRIISLYGADSAQVDQVVQAPAGLPALQIIYAAASRIDADTFPRLTSKPLTGLKNPFFGVANVYVTLEHKLGTPLMSTAIVLSATMPPPIYTRP